MNLNLNQLIELETLIVHLKTLKCHKLTPAEQLSIRSHLTDTFRKLDELQVSFRIQNKIIALIDNNFEFNKAFLMDTYNDKLVKIALEVA